MFPYFGAKHRLAPTYQPPVHTTIIEPFAGAAGYSMYWLQRDKRLRSVLVDRDPIVVNLWRRLLAMDPLDIWNYPIPTQGALSDDPVYLVGSVSSGSWGRYATSGDFQVTERQASHFRREMRRIANTVSNVAGRVSITHGDYTDAPDVEATWFVDPPYQTQGIHYNHNNDLNFAALGGWAKGRLGQTIVTECLGADWMDFEPHRMNMTVRNQESTEVVWYSHPEPTLFSVNN